MSRTQEIAQADFIEHFEEDDFFLKYGNPVVVNCNDGKRAVVVAWPLAKRIMRDAGLAEETCETVSRAAKDA